LLESEWKRSRSPFGAWRYRRGERECIRRADATLGDWAEWLAPARELGVVDEETFDPSRDAAALEELYGKLHAGR
jgi:hypothetical protein